MKRNTHERGIALLVTLLIMTVILGVSSSLLNVTLKQYQFSSIGLQSEIAFHAANAGVECLMYHDYLNYPISKFDVNGNGTGTTSESNVLCMGQTSNDFVNGGNTVVSGEEQRFQFNWQDTTVAGSPTLCTNVSIYKYYNTATAQDMSASLGRPVSCTAGVICTVIKSRGYNVPCSATTTPRTVERELTQRY
jgi:hypothetical protein